LAPQVPVWELQELKLGLSAQELQELHALQELLVALLPLVLLDRELDLPSLLVALLLVLVEHLLLEGLLLLVEHPL
jgi:hypothetical protein